MSNYRGYASPWLKSSAYTSSTSKNDIATPKFESGNIYSKCGSTAGKKYGYNSSTSSGTNNTDASSSGSSYNRDKPKACGSTVGGNVYGKSNLVSRFKTAIEKKDSKLTYRPLGRSENRSRDPSAERNSSSSSSFGYVSLYAPAATTSRSLRSPISREKSKDDFTHSYSRPTSISSSKEDINVGSNSNNNKYITSRFLPKNTVEKSQTAYIRPAASRIASSQREASRKNRELLNLIHVQQQSEKSRANSKSPSTSSLYYHNDKSKSNDNIEKKEKNDETKNVSVISRSTSPTLPSPTSFLNSKRVDMTRLVEKQIIKSVRSNPNLVDKQTQSDIIEENNSKTVSSSGSSSKTSSRSNSIKSTISLKSEKIKEEKVTKNQLPPHIPSSNLQKFQQLPQNKDFRKSVLNMNPTEIKTGKKKVGKRTESVSSIESELSTDNSNGKSSKNKILSNSKLSNSSPSESKKFNRTRSGGTISDGSGNEDDSKEKRGKSQGSNCSSSENERPSRLPVSSKLKGENGTEAKSFLMRALAPVTSLFKTKHHHDSVSDKPSDWLEDDTTLLDVESEIVYNSNDKSFIDTTVDEASICDHNINDISLDENQKEGTPEQRTSCIKSGEKAWWSLDGFSEKESTPSPKTKYKIRPIESGERAWWLESSSVEKEDTNNKTREGCIATNNNLEIRKSSSTDRSRSQSGSNQKITVNPEYPEKYKIRHIDSGERAWWLDSQEDIPEGVIKWEPTNETDSNVIGSGRTSCGSFVGESIPLGDRASPEGLENPNDNISGRLSPYDNVPRQVERPKHLFISNHTNIDDLLGGRNYSLSPLMDRIFNYQVDNTSQIQSNQFGSYGANNKWKTNEKLDDVALQLYKDGDYGAYLDLDASISEQNEEFEGFHSGKKNSIVLRTQLSVRVHTIIEKLLTSEGRDLRRALFSLKQIFQEDKDLVHEFVQNDGLACLIKVGSEADQNYQNYILRALGQVMLYVDGMNGVIQHNETVQWLYSLISSKFRLVVKTALKLLLVFVEYTESNCMLLIKAVEIVDCSNGLAPWSNVMKLLKDFDSADTELLIYAMTLINKCFNGIPDQDTYYDQTDSLEEQGIEAIIQRYMSKPGTDLDLLQQFQIYEAVLQYEDNDDDDKGTPLRHLDESFRKTLRNRKSVVVESTERRKSRRHSTGTAPVHTGLSQTLRNHLETFTLSNNEDDDDDDEDASSAGSEDIRLGSGTCNKENAKANDAGVTPALKRRRERAERQRSFMREQQESAALLRGCFMSHRENNDSKTYYTNNNSVSYPSANINNSSSNNNNINSGVVSQSGGTYGNGQKVSNVNLANKIPGRKDLLYMNNVNKLDSEDNGASLLNKSKPWILSMMYNGKKSVDEEQSYENMENIENVNENDRKSILQIKKENTVKDLTQKLSIQNVLQSPTEEKINRIGDMSGLISKAKEGLAKSKSNASIKSPTSESVPKIETKKTENELRWEELAKSLNRPLNLCDIDFTDLTSDDETDILAPALPAGGIPPPPPPLLPNANSQTGAPPPPPLVANKSVPPVPPNAPLFGIQKTKQTTESKIPIKKNKKTVKLFWKEVRDDPIISIKLKTGLIWDELSSVTVDTQKLEHLFESRAKDLITKKQQELNKNKEIIVLDNKRSNAINIGMTKLPPPRSIKTAILKMDATIMNREGIEKLLTMLPTEEERTKIQEAQAANPDLPLGSAEQFLLTLASISELPARLKLWAFKLDFENTEREIAEPLMDLKQGIEILKVNKTFRGILSTLLSIGIFLNGTEVKGFQIEYLSKVPEVKDTVHKHSLLHHLCHILMEKFPDVSDLYSEIGAITRASKIDFDELTLNVQRLEADCKASWDHLKLIAKHDGSTMMKVKMSDFLTDCAKRIIILTIIHRRIINRFHKFLLWLGIPLHQIADTKPNEFCKIISEFALEYRTTRERVLQQLEKKANHRERNKTRGKMITEIGKFRSKEDRADAELKQLLGSDISDVESLQGTLPWRRRSKDPRTSFVSQTNGNLTDGDDEILESLVKTATKGPSSRTAPRERKRTRHADRKSLRRTLKSGLSEEEKKHLSTYIKSY